MKKNHYQSFETSRNQTLVRMLNIESKQNVSTFEIRNEITTLGGHLADNNKEDNIKYTMTQNMNKCQLISDIIHR